MSKRRPLKLFESSKLFYSEYLYKLVIRNELSHIFRTEFQKKEKLSFAKQELDRLAEDYRNNLPLYKKAWRTDIFVSDSDYLDASTVYDVLNNSDEYKITLFSNNRQFLMDLGNNLNTDIINFWEPDVNYVELLKSKTKIQIVDVPAALPVKVWFNSTRVNKDFGNWIRSNRDKCKIGKIALDSLDNFGYLNGLYIYLRDDKVLSLVTIMAGASIRCVEKLVYSGDIDKY